MRGASEMGPRKSISKLSRPDPNFLVHDYLGLSLPRVWDVVERDLPAFRAAVMGNWGTLLPSLTYADPVRGAVVALVAFCFVRCNWGQALIICYSQNGTRASLRCQGKSLLSTSARRAFVLCARLPRGLSW